MKTNGLRNKKRAMARAAYRCCFRYSFVYPWERPAVERWHRAAKGRR